MINFRPAEKDVKLSYIDLVATERAEIFMKQAFCVDMMDKLKLPYYLTCGYH